MQHPKGVVFRESNSCGACILFMQCDLNECNPQPSFLKESKHQNNPLLLMLSVGLIL